MKSPLFTWIQFFQFYLPLLPTFHPLLPIGCACPLNKISSLFLHAVILKSCLHLKSPLRVLASHIPLSLKGRRWMENRLLDFIEKSGKWTFSVAGTKIRSLEARKERRGENSRCDSFIWLLDSKSDQQCQYGGNSVTAKACACVIRMGWPYKGIVLGMRT